MVTTTDLGPTNGNELQPATTVHRFSVVGDDGAELDLLDLGAAVDLVRLPDRDGVVADVTLTLDTIADREDPVRNPHLGVTVGRYANRIGGSRFAIDGVEHRVVANEGPNQLHGGPVGFGALVWEHEVLTDGVRFHRTSPAGEMGFPGTLDASVTYRLEPGTITVEHEATTDDPTIVSLTNHTYWNLGGPNEVDILDHVVTIPAGAVVPGDEQGLPTGPPVSVDDGPFDLRRPALLGGHIGFSLPAGYDHCLLPDGEGFRVHGRIDHPPSGRWLEVWSDAPAVQLYTGGHLSGPAEGRGRHHGPFAALCVEPEHVPDAPNHHWAPSPVLRPGERYLHRLQLRYGAD